MPSHPTVSAKASARVRAHTRLRPARSCSAPVRRLRLHAGSRRRQGSSSANLLSWKIRQARCRSRCRVASRRKSLRMVGLVRRACRFEMAEIDAEQHSPAGRGQQSTKSVEIGWVTVFVSHGGDVTVAVHHGDPHWLRRYAARRTRQPHQAHKAVASSIEMGGTQFLRLR